MSGPLVTGITAVMSEAVAVAVGFGVLSNNQAGLALSLGQGLVTLGVLIYAALHKHTQAMTASKQSPNLPPAGVSPAALWQAAKLLSEQQTHPPKSSPPSKEV